LTIAKWYTIKIFKITNTELDHIGIVSINNSIVSWFKKVAAINGSIKVFMAVNSFGHIKTHLLNTITTKKVHHLSPF